MQILHVQLVLDGKLREFRQKLGAMVSKKFDVWKSFWSLFGFSFCFSWKLKFSISSFVRNLGNEFFIQKRKLLKMKRRKFNYRIDRENRFFKKMIEKENFHVFPICIVKI